MLAVDQLSEAHDHERLTERERQQYRQEIDSLTRAVDKARHDCLTQLKEERERAAAELEAERGVASAKVERYPGSTHGEHRARPAVCRLSPTALLLTVAKSVVAARRASSVVL